MYLFVCSRFCRLAELHEMRKLKAFIFLLRGEKGEEKSWNIREERRVSGETSILVSKKGQRAKERGLLVLFF